MSEPTPLGPGPWTVVHDFAYVLAGAERVSKALANLVVPGAPMMTIAGHRAVLDEMQVAGGWRRVLPLGIPGEAAYRWLTPLYPSILRNLSPVEGNVICSSYAFSHHVRSTGAKVVYCHTPLRQVWSGREGYREHYRGARRLLLDRSTERLRRADLAAAEQADLYVASSEAVRLRIEQYYGRRDVPVVAPPLDTSVFNAEPAAPNQGYFLWVGRIVEPYKRLEMTIEAFKGLPHRLVVAGEGRDRRRLEAGAPANVTFVGWQDDRSLAALYRGALAVVFPSEDDFGLVPVESMACGTPSVAYSAGGAQETVVDGHTGLFFAEQTPASLSRRLVDAANTSWDRAAIAEHGRNYGVGNFTSRMQALVGSVALSKDKP